VTALGLIPVATDDDGALVTALAIKAALNTHEASTVFHTIADATNIVTSPSPAAGTLITNDIVKVDTFAPTPDPADIFDGSTTPPTGALATLAISPQSFSMIALDFPSDLDMAETISLGLDYMASRGKDVVALYRSRIPNPGESETDWSDFIKDEFGDFEDYRMVRRDGYGLVTDSLTGRQYLRSTFSALVSNTVRVPLVVWPNSPNDRPQAGVRLSDEDGADVGHDEGSRGSATGLADETQGFRASCDFRDVNAPNPESVYGSLPFTSYGPTDSIKNLMTARVVFAVKRVALQAAFLTLGGTIAYEAADPNVFGSVPTLPEATRVGLQSSILAAIAARFTGVIQNANDADIDTGLVRIPTTATITSGNLVTVAASLSIQVFGYLIEISLPISIQE
jgi:hypothetical protein